MRKIFTFSVLCCATTLRLFPPLVGRQQARQAALAFIKSHVSTNSQVATRASQATPSLNEVASTNAYYIFNVGKGQGFVIASADDRTADVLGYAEEGNIRRAAMSGIAQDALGTISTGGEHAEQHACHHKACHHARRQKAAAH